MPSPSADRCSGTPRGCESTTLSEAATHSQPFGNVAVSSHTIELTDTLHAYLLAHGHPRVFRCSRTTHAHAVGDALAPHADLAGAGRVHAGGGSADRCQADDRGGHVHRLQRPGGGRGASRGRRRARLRHLRGVDRHRNVRSGSAPAWQRRSTCTSGPPWRPSTSFSAPARRAVSTSPSSTPTRPTTIVYYERCLELLRAGGVIGIDNVLWGGRVADDSARDDDTRAIRALNAKVATDDRVDVSMLPVGDGLTLAVKR